MASDTDNIAEALAIISQIESARASESLEDLTDAELLQRIAEFYSDDENERRLVLYALAVQGNPAPTPERIERACRELESLGIDGFDSDSLLAMYVSPAYHEFERACAECDALSERHFEGPDADWEAFERACERVRDLAIAAGSIAARRDAPVIGRHVETRADVRRDRPHSARSTAATRACGR